MTIVISPLLSITFNVLLGSDLGAPDLARTAHAATLVGMGLGVTSGVVSKVATDRNLGVFQEVHQYRRLDVAYWIGSALMPMVLVLPTGLACLGAIALATGAAGFESFAVLSVLTLGVLTVGALLGVSMAGLGVAMSDPYQGSNIASAIVPILAGVIVPAGLFPQWLSAVSYAIPCSGIVRALTDVLAGAGFDWFAILTDLSVSFVWACGGLSMVGVAIRKMRSGLKFNSL
ncbi:ABC transporter [Trueperella bialowiezensis]|uniref:ABC transporter n=1 Tax=Trueperella bialowiezensis TaxID=312285 RepID=UPI000F8234AC|nr:ABC transporter [Trueperella bialowiezensis]